MTTLRIEHAITDFDTWKAAFDKIAPVRAQAGVRSHTIRLPAGDPHYLMLDLEFETDSEAEAFASFLENKIWASPTSAPALAGVPRTRILTVVA